MSKIMLWIIGILVSIVLIISKEPVFLVPIILCTGFVGMIEAIEKLGKEK